MRRWLNGYIAFALAMTAAGALAPSNACAEDSPTRIGFIADLTGGLAPIGAGYDRGTRAAAEMWNAQSGKRKVEISSCDSQSTGAGALACYQRLKGTVDAFAGPSLYLGIAAVRGIAEKGGLPMMTAAPMAALSGEAASTSQIFQDLPTLGDAARAGLAYFKKQGLTRIALLTSNDIPGTLTADAAKDFAAANGITLVRIEQFDTTAQSLAPQTENIAAAKPDAVLAAIIGAPLIIGLRAFKTANITVPVMLNYASMNSQLLVAAESAAGNNLFFSATKSLDRDSIADPAFKTRVETYDAAFNRLFNQSPDFVAYVAADVALILAQAGNAAAGAKKMHDLIESGTKFDGVLWPTYSFSPTKHAGQTGVEAFDVLQWRPEKKSWTLAK
jgi:ABC-type branched-subunit amino acid transport system substrate-binding protein